MSTATPGAGTARPGGGHEGGAREPRVHEPGVHEPGVHEPDAYEPDVYEGAARPVDVCRALLEALDASEGLRRRRKRNTRPDAIGLGIKREILEAAVDAAPDGDAFEGWLLERCFAQGPREGAWRAMALEIFDEWRMAAAAPSFRAWLEAGAPSDDKPGATGPVPAGGGCPVHHGAGRGEATHRRALGILLAVAVGTGAAGLAGCDDGPDAGDVPSVDVEPMDESERQTAGRMAQVLPPLLASEAAGLLVYDAPVSLARPPGAETWPPGPGGVAIPARSDSTPPPPGDSTPTVPPVPPADSTATTPRDTTPPDTTPPDTTAAYSARP